MKPEIQAFFDDATFTVSYVVIDSASRHAAIIDPVLDYEPRAARTRTSSAERMLAAVRARNAELKWILETHAHADHLSAAAWLRAKTGAPIAIGEHIRDVQHVFRPIFHADDLKADGAPFDRLLADGDVLELGQSRIEVIHTPGHTPACVSYRIGDDVFVGDTLFMPDYGTARADFPGGDARTLFRSIRRLLNLPPATRLWMCHDYRAPGRENYAWQSTVADERSANIHVRDGIREEDFVDMRTARDRSLAPPNLLLPSIQVNIRAGRMPPPDSDGHTYLRIPVNRL